MDLNLREVLNDIVKSSIQDTNTLIAKEILKELDSGKKPSINEIAENTFSNKSTVTRFAKNLNFEGYRQFVEILMIQEEKYYSPMIKTLSENEVFSDVKNKSNKIIEEISNYFNIFEEIAKQIHSSKTVNIFTSIQNLQIGQSLSQELLQLGIKTRFVEYNQQQVLSSIVDEKDVNIFIASGISNTTLSKIFNNLKTICELNYVMSTSSQSAKFKDAKHLIKIEVGKSVVREQLKNHAFRYICMQIVNLLINHDSKYTEILSNPKFKY